MSAPVQAKSEVAVAARTATATARVAALLVAICCDTPAAMYPPIENVIAVMPKGVCKTKSKMRPHTNPITAALAGLR